MAEKRSHGEAFDLEADADGGVEVVDEQPKQPAKAAPTETINPLTGTPYSRRFHELLEKRRKLPCWSARTELLRVLKESQVTILVGEPGCGKTTQLPQILLDAGYHVQDGQLRAIMCAEPHATAASSAAIRVAEELEVPVGSYVGYAAEWDIKTSNETLIKYATHNMLLRELMMDPGLEKYSVVMVDEMHDRTQEADVFCGLLKEVLSRRPELRAIITSAVTDVKKLRSSFPGSAAISVSARQFPVEIYYTPSPQNDYLKTAITSALQVHASEPDGDILIFLASDEEINYACVEIRKEVQAVGLRAIIVAPLYGTLTQAQQQKAFESAPKKDLNSRPTRKIIVATEIAETSLAIDGVVYVIDSGFTQHRIYNPRIRLDTTVVAPANKSSAVARAACAGRAIPGKCFRLYSDKVLNDLPSVKHTEMLRSDISASVLLLKALGIDDIVHFDFIDPPAVETLMRSLESLNYLGFLNEQGLLTPLGEMAVKFPVEPQLAKMLIESPTHRCSNEALSIASMLSTSQVFLRPKTHAKQADEARARFAHLDGDHLTLLNVFHAYKQQVQDGTDPGKFCADNFVSHRALKFAEGIRDQLKLLMELQGLKMVSTDFQDKEYYPNIRRCILSGYFQQVAYLSRDKPGNVYLTARDNHEAFLHPFGCLNSKPDWVLFHDLTFTSRYYVRTITQVKPEWLLDLAPRFYNLDTFPKSEARFQLEKVVQRRGAQAVG